MPRNKRQFQKSKEAIECRAARAREIRDLYSKLRKKYRPTVVDKFFRDNYFMAPRTIEKFIRASDKKPVMPEHASIIYKTAMQETFNL